MPDKSNSPFKFWEELKRRKVVRVIIAYVAVSVGIIELINNVWEPLLLPEWTPTMVIIILSIGFPIAVIFAWIFDITSKGIRKTPQIKNDSRGKDIQKIIDKRSIPDKSIIVLPFENISSDPEQEYFSDGLTEELITHLSYIKELVVISRSSAMTFKGVKNTIHEVAEKTNVRYVLEGSVRKSENKIRITAQLIDAKTDSHLWAKNYDGTLDDIFDIQEKVSVSIANELKIKLNDPNQEVGTTQSINNLQIFEYYYRATANIYKYNEEDINQAIKDIEEAIEKVGEHAIFYTGKAFAFWMLVNLGIKQEDYLILAKECLDKALIIQPEFARAHSLYGWIEFVFSNFIGAKNHLRKAIEIDPNDQFALGGMVILYSVNSYSQIAAKLLQRLEKVDPLNDVTRWCKGSIPFYEGRFIEAQNAWYEFYKDSSNSYSIFYYALAMIYSKDKTEVLSLIEPVIVPDSNYIADRILRIFKYAINSDKEKLLAELDSDFVKTCKRDATYAHHLTVLLSYCGLKNEALDWLEQSIKVGYVNYPMIKEKDKLLENIRGEKRFKKLMERVKHEWEKFEL